jgi:hypothetical protein
LEGTNIYNGAAGDECGKQFLLQFGSTPPKMPHNETKKESDGLFTPVFTVKRRPVNNLQLSVKARTRRTTPTKSTYA